MRGWGSMRSVQVLVEPSFRTPGIECMSVMPHNAVHRLWRHITVYSCYAPLVYVHRCSYVTHNLYWLSIMCTHMDLLCCHCICIACSVYFYSFYILRTSLTNSYFHNTLFPGETVLKCCCYVHVALKYS